MDIKETDSVLNIQKFKKKLWGHWWFWVIVVILALGVWQVKERIDASVLSQREVDMQIQKASWRQMDIFYKVQQDRTVDMLRADTYGGETPEKTLQLFVEALESGDAVLASKYYLPWMQDGAEKEMGEWMIHESLKKFLDAYHDGVVKRGDRAVNAAMEVYYDEDDIYHYTLEMDLNTETNLWKISDF